MRLRNENRPKDSDYRAAAKKLWHDEGSIEVDTDTKDLPTGFVSRAEDENGAYVLAWVWVPDEDL